MFALVSRIEHFGMRMFSTDNNIGSGFRTARGSLNLKPYSKIFCNVTETHEENAVGLVKT